MTRQPHHLIKEAPMPHPLVTYLRFTRSEFQRCLAGLSPADAIIRLGPTNSISWMVGHLAWQENLYWVIRAQGRNAAPALEKLVGFGRPATTPPLDEMWAAWQAVTAAADEYLDALTPALLLTFPAGAHDGETVGAKLLRNIYHYWFHTGEAHAVRQQLGHKNLPEFVGDMTHGLYRPESE
jgi:uncharacterized damage-inducible protein DinB